jgi:DNA-binding response OmpR family regulator
MPSVTPDAARGYAGGLVVVKMPALASSALEGLMVFSERQITIFQLGQYQLPALGARHIMVPIHTILVIDDEPLLRRSLMLILQRAGYQVTIAGSAREARHYLQAGPYDLIFLDLKMPEVDGLTFLAEIRARYPDLPVLILTAHATLESAMEAVRQGARDYLLKPIMPDAILARVAEVLQAQARPRRQREITTQIDELVAELKHLDGLQAPIDHIDHGAGSPAAGAQATAALEPERYLQRGKFTLDLHTRRVLLRDQQILLPPVTFDYLVTLMRHSPNPVPYEVLVEESQGFRASRAEAREIARGRIHALRKALEQDQRHPEFVVTVRNIGYNLVT